MVTLFHTLVQSASKTKVPKSFGSGKLRRNEASIFWVPGFHRFSGLVRGALPIRYCAVLTVETFAGVVNAPLSKY
jgi:hypothetical protein